MSDERTFHWQGSSMSKFSRWNRHRSWQVDLSDTSDNERAHSICLRAFVFRKLEVMIRKKYREFYDSCTK